MWRHQALGFRSERGEKRHVLRWGDCREARVGARRVSGRAGVRGHFFYEEMVNVGCFFWAPGPNSNIQAGPGECRGAHKTLGRPWAAAGICEFSLSRTLFTRRRPWTPRLRMAAARRPSSPSCAVAAGSVWYRRLEVPAATSSPGCHLLVQAVSCACDPQSLNQRVPQSPPQVLIIC